MIGFRGGDMNLFAYVFQDPILLTDGFGDDVYFVEYGWYTYFHKAIIIGNAQEGYVEYGFGPESPVKGALSVFGLSVKGRVEIIPSKSQAGKMVKVPLLGKDVVKRLITTPKQDQIAIELAEKYSQMSKWNKYRVWGNQCSHYAKGLFREIEAGLEE